MGKELQGLKRAIKKATRRYASALDSVGRSYLKLWELNSYGVAEPSSLAQAEDDFLSGRFGEDYGDVGAGISELAGARLVSAADHLNSTAALLTPSNTGVFSVWATGRAMLEAAGLAYWLLDPDVDPDSRYVRGLNDRLNSLAGAIRFMERGKVSLEDVVTNPTDTMDHVIQRAQTFGFSIDGDGRNRRVRGQKLPSWTELVDHLTEPGVYSVFSGYSHNEIWALGHQQTPMKNVNDPSGLGRSFSKASISLQDYQSLGQRLVTGFTTSVERHIRYHGWEEIDNWTTTVTRSRSSLSKLL